MGTVICCRCSRRTLTLALAVLALTAAQFMGAVAPPAAASNGPERAEVREDDNEPDGPLAEPESERTPDDPEPEADPEPALDDPGPEPAISIDKTVTGGVEFDEDGDAYVVVTGGATHDILYEFAITNTGTEDLTDLTLSDDRIGDLSADLDAEVTGGVLAIDETVTVTAAHEDVGVDTFEDGLLVNVGAVAATGSESGERVTAQDEARVFDVELAGGQTPVEQPAPPVEDEAADPDVRDGEVDGEVEVLAEVLTDPDAEDELPETGLADVRLALLGLLLTTLGLTALTARRPDAPDDASTR